MADEQHTGGEEPRRGDRRMADRRKTDRRSPAPAWRRPAAMVAYGVAGTLLLLAVFRAMGDADDGGREAIGNGEVVAAPSPVPVTETPVQPSPPERGLSTADFERLTLEGDAARGRRVVALLYCEPPSPVAVQGDTIESAVSALVDTAGGRRVPAAVCKWGARDDPRRGEFLLLVPPHLAGEFSSAPVAMDGFIRRRRLVAEVEWLGKSRALALRTAGIFRGLATEPAPES